MFAFACGHIVEIEFEECVCVLPVFGVSVIHPIWKHNCHIAHLVVLKALLQEMVRSKPNVSSKQSHAVTVESLLCDC